MAPTGAPVRPAKAALNYLAVCVAVIAVVWASLAAAGISLNFDFVAQYRVRIWDGFCMTVGISAASLVVRAWRSGSWWPQAKARASCRCATCATST